IGVATTPGTYSFTLRVSSGGATSDVASTIKVIALGASESQVPDGFVSVPYSAQLHAQGISGAVTWTATSALPAGLTLSATGLLSGTPTAAGFANVQFTVADGTDKVFSNVNVQI